ncbi:MULTISPECIES: acyltransferase [unclassified Empedobacter]|uniref:acyltransferase family protein n=2 Tax=Empedobacter TaxID=59734 RepID=UPI0025B9AD37|nr:MULTISPECIES: acyltransferase [unclassified Empedobacter]
MERGRIKVFDSLRVLAILMVFIHHYYSSKVYPELGELFLYGAFGVPLFFMISGFVISLTLERTDNFKTYLKNRFIRLSPAMIICSTLTFVFFAFFYTGEGYEHSKNIWNYLIANTFIDPHVFDLYSGEIKYYYLDNAYWSLWVEVCFYIIIGTLYFMNKRKYLLHFIIICIIMMPLQMIFYSHSARPYLLNYFSESQLDYYRLVARCLALFSECIWFIIGMFLLRLYQTKDKKFLYIIIFLLGLSVLKELNSGILVFSVSVFIFILLFVYKPEKLKFLEQPFLLKIGAASYCMYLIHYHLGVVFVKYLNENFKLGYFSPVIVIIFVIVFGLVCYKFFEKKLIKLYKRILK